jgi:GAF domain-containing protein
MPDSPIAAIEAALTSGRPFDAVCQDVCRLLSAGVKHYNWVGVYMLDGAREMLELRAWDGAAATEHTRIPIGQGICGLAAREAKTVVVDDVRKDPRYLQCFLHTRAEIVVPIFKDKAVVGEIDIDSDLVASFGETDQIFLEWLAGKLGALYRPS